MLLMRDDQTLASIEFGYEPEPGRATSPCVSQDRKRFCRRNLIGRWGINSFQFVKNFPCCPQNLRSQYAF